jgi:hypothetical protein
VTGGGLDPGLEIGDGVDDAAAELVIDRPGPVTAMLFEGAWGEIE